MEKDNIVLLRKRFVHVVRNYWRENDHDLSGISCVYAILSIDYRGKELDIEYIGSTINLFLRYKSHKIPAKIQGMGKLNLLYYLPMEKGFYDYERKLIKRLQPLFNKQHK